MWKSEWPVLHRLASDQLAWLNASLQERLPFCFCVCVFHSLSSAKRVLRFREKLERERERERERENGRVQDRTLTVGDIFFRAISTHTVSTLCYLTVSPFQFIFFLFVCMFVSPEKNEKWVLMCNGLWFEFQVKGC